MKIAKVDHYQCDEFSTSSYVWIPDEMTIDQFSNVLDEAEKDYIAYLKEWNKTIAVPYVNFHPDYSKAPKYLTIKEVEDKHETELAKYKEWEANERKAKRTFSAFLADLGLKQLYEHEPEYKLTIDWGHNHGLGIEKNQKLPY